MGSTFTFLIAIGAGGACWAAAEGIGQAIASRNAMRRALEGLGCGSFRDASVPSYLLIF